MNTQALAPQSVALNRRRLLLGAAASAVSVPLAACSRGNGDAPGEADGPNGETPRGSAAEPLSPPDTYGEAPTLTELVEAGEIPPVEERLPERPYVVPHNWLTTGTYGGTLRMPSPGTDHASNKEFMYGHSLLRWLNDCLDLGPGLAESFESSDDATVWTFHLREGVKWSDGYPFTTADILFWWEDLVLNEDYPASPPDELRSGAGTIAQMSAPDDYTLILTFDVPAPLTADRVANWVNGGGAPTGAIWVLPKHYLDQFHPAYNPDAPADWAEAGGALDLEGDFARNPDCPTLTGWRVISYREADSIEWERNPYYWCVDPEGNQLPYIDRVVMTAIGDPEVAKLQLHEGGFDYAHGPFNGVELADVAEFNRNEEHSGLRVLLWDSGAGGGATLMFNQDYFDETYRELFRDQRFRRALSHAIDREDVRNGVYFDTGEVTTGTLSPKAIEYNISAEGEAIYRQWRDSYADHDTDLAEQLLDEVGLVDSNGDGNREFADGSPLEIRIDHPANARESHLQNAERVARDWNAIGVATTLNPIPPEAYPVQWSAGELMINTTWEIGDGPNHLVFPNFLVPIDSDRWAPLQGSHYAVRGTPNEGTEEDVDPYDRTPPRMDAEPGGPIERLWELYDETKTEPEEMRRHQLVWEMIKIHIDEGPFMHGSVADYLRVILARHELRNVPLRENLAQGGFVNPWIHPTPAVYDPEAYFWDEPENHE